MDIMERGMVNDVLLMEFNNNELQSVLHMNFWAPKLELTK